MSQRRIKVIDKLGQELVKLLHELGIPEANIKIHRQEIEVGSKGIDNLTIQFSANKGIAPEAIDRVASGGEFSRLMFAIKFILAKKKSMPTLVLDEIDTGVSGEIAMQLGRLMRSMASRHQVLCITHLPQIASKGDKHFYVFKDNSTSKTISTIKELDHENRIAEIAQMIGGAQPSSHAIEGAKEMLLKS